jgi:hypothetical protein
MRQGYKMEYTVSLHFSSIGLFCTHRIMFLRGTITQDIDSAEVFRGIDNFCRFFTLILFELLAFENSGADLPTAVRVRVKT